ncbi:hypothetical protein Taro_029969 [Colocasia esculenta]|uniref:PHD finger protein ALFIN-LIKE n=1 Tax=Colocasia esculenta TaxID=4460 RepID=A0A843VSQ5_COLES|nr:hypothetical protein [Colocasia esculenta]
MFKKLCSHELICLNIHIGPTGHWFNGLSFYFPGTCSFDMCPSVTSKLIQLKICQAYLMKVFIFHLDYPFAMFTYRVFHFSTSMLEFPPKSSSHDFALMYIYQLPFLLCPPIWKRLFSMINDLPTVFEVVTDRKQAKEKSGIDSGSKSKLSTKRSSDGLVKNHSKPIDEEYDVEDDEHSETLCGICGSNYNSDEFWICCDVCERWFHGKCVKITPAKAESIKQYKCPNCSSKKGRQVVANE